MKLRREARTLKEKALCSLRRAVTAFNACEEDGRIGVAVERQRISSVEDHRPHLMIAVRDDFAPRVIIGSCMRRNRIVEELPKCSVTFHCSLP